MALGSPRNLRSGNELHRASQARILRGTTSGRDIYLTERVINDRLGGNSFPAEASTSCFGQGLGELKGSIYSARPIMIDRPVWRVDLLESVAGLPGSLDRAHHHPAFREWEPGPRYFVEGLSARPLERVGARLSDLDALLEQAGMAAVDVGTGDAEALRQAVPEMMAVLGEVA